MNSACFGIFTNIFTTPSTRNQATLPLLSGNMTDNDEPITKAGCIFCDVTVEKGFRVHDSTERLIAFHDRSPGAQTHILVIPRQHISTVKDLREHHIPLLTEMESFGHRILNDLGVSESGRRLGFHIPPFSSVHHIHLHALSLPLTHRWACVKYRNTRRGPSYLANPPQSEPTQANTVRVAEEARTGRVGKKWGWFVDVRDAKDILAAGKTIKVGSVRA
ncbi:hypothetical protein FFLO_00044 [Filobasidium floriforme]|uniref:HIT domain-containing protein n=1 Tax=Filobasidium floriforme TaxID=5210 RepID=A0A8K0JS46_9TREE|nr:hypothetical protein FFLO_00044 [Filobasidium floriforme]